jgi:hypothetical protein
MSEPSKTLYQSLVGALFRIDFDDEQSVQLHLQSLQDNGHLDEAQTEHFTLLFTGPQEQGLMQAMYPMQHAALGVAHIFIVPVGFENNECLYEAVFSCRKATMPA